MKPFHELLKRQPSAENRSYLLNYVARELFDGKKYVLLFTLLDDKSYKYAKLEYDPSTTLYAGDLDLGRKTAAAESWGMWKQIDHLPHLWRYTLLRCSLTSRVDAYPDAAFLLLLRLGHQEQAERSAELLTSAAQRARVFSLIGSEYALQPGQADQSVRLFEQAYASVQSMVDKTERNTTLSALSQTCIQGSQFSLAQRMITSIEDSTKRTEGLQALSQALTKARQWELAREVIALLEDNKERNTALKALAQTLVQAGEWQLAWEVFTTIEDSAEKAQELSTFGTAMAQANDLQSALHIWREALRVLLSNENNGTAAGDLAKALLDNGEQEALQLWMELKEGITSIKTLFLRDGALYYFCQPLIQLNVWPLVMDVIRSMQTAPGAIKTLSDSGQGLVAFSEELTQAGKEEDAARIRDLANQIWQAIREAIATLEGSTKATELNVFGKSLMQAHLEQEALQAWRESRDILLAAAHDNFWDIGQLSSLSKHLAQAGHGEEALDILRVIDDSEKRDKEYYELLKVLLATQQWQLARDVSHTIQHSSERRQGFEETYQALIQAREWKQALEVIEEMRHAEVGDKYELNSINADVLQEVHKVLAQAKDTQEAAQLWQEMQIIFATIPTRDNERINAQLRGLVKVLAQSEQWQAARDIVKSVDDYTEGSVAAREFCQILARAHRWQEAHEVAASFWKDSEQAWALSELGLELVAAGQRQEADKAWQETQQVLAQTVSDQQRARALRYISLGLAQSRQWIEALQIISTLGHQEEADVAIGEVAREMILFGDEDIAAKAWQAPHSIGANSPSPTEQVRALNEIGLALVQVGRVQEALEVWQEAQKVIDSIHETFWQKHLTEELVQKMIQAGQWREAQGIYGSVSNRSDVDKELGKLGTRLVQADQLREAQELQKMLATMSASSQARELASELSPAFIRQGSFQEAREMLDSITDTSQRIQVLSELGLAMAQANQKQESQQIWQEVRDLLPGIEEGITVIRRSPIYHRVKGLSTFGQAMALANEKQEAFQVWQEARELIQALTNSPSKVEELGKLGQAMALANYEQEAFQVWQEAQSLISTLKEYSEKVEALGILGLAMAQANREQQAWQVWQEALAIIASTDERIVDLFESLGAVSVKEQQRLSREDALKVAHALRKIGQELAEDYQFQGGYEEVSVIGEAIGAVLSPFLGLEESERINIQDAGRVMGIMMIGIASNSVSARTLNKFSEVLAKAQRWQEAREVLMTIEDYPRLRDIAGYALAYSLAQAERWQEAYEAATSIEGSKRITILKGMARDLAQKKQWQEAWKMLAAIEDGEERTEALHELSSTVMQFYNEVHLEVVNVYFHRVCEQGISPEQEKLEVLRVEDYLQLLTLLRQVWTALTTSEEALAAFPLVHGFVQRDPELGKALAQSFTWVADFLKHGDEVSL